VGNITSIEFTGEKRDGTDEPWVFEQLREAGGEGRIDMSGEDGDTWSW